MGSLKGGTFRNRMSSADRYLASGKDAKKEKQPERLNKHISLIVQPSRLPVR